MAKNTTGGASANTKRVALGIGGLLALVVGVLILVWPDKSAMAVTALIAAYAFIAGIVYIGLGIFATGKGGWVRTGYIALGAVFVIGGIITFANLQATTLWLTILVGILVGILWIVEGIAALMSLRNKQRKAWTIVFAVLSLVAGVVLLFSPLFIATIWWLLGGLLAILGVIQIVRAFRYGKAD